MTDAAWEHDRPVSTDRHALKVTRQDRVDFDDRAPGPDDGGRFDWDHFCRVNAVDSEFNLGSRI